MIPTKPLLIALAVLLICAGLYRVGHQAGANAVHAERLASVQRAIAQAEVIARQDAEVLGAHEARAERVRTEFRTIDREVIRYVALHADDDRDCLTPDGLRLWCAANAGHADAGCPDQPHDPAAGNPAAPRLGTVGGLAGQPRRGDGAVPPGARADTGLGGVVSGGASGTAGVAAP